jgi:GTP-binding protein
VTPSDAEIVRGLQQTDKKVFYVANKIDAEKHENLVFDFYSLGVDPIFGVSALTGYGMDDLLDALLAEIPEAPAAVEEAAQAPESVVRVAVGETHRGKSSLINCFGEERLLANPERGPPGPIDTVVRHHGKNISSDTAEYDGAPYCGTSRKI